MKGKHLICVMVLLLGACLTVGGCSDTRYVLVPAAPTQVSDGVYDFQPPQYPEQRQFVDISVFAKGLQQNFAVAPILHFNRDDMGRVHFVMSMLFPNLYSSTVTGVRTGGGGDSYRLVELNLTDSSHGSSPLFNENKLDPTYGDQLLTVMVSNDGGQHSVPVSWIPDNDLAFFLDDKGNIIVNSCDILVEYTPPANLPITRSPDFYFAWYFDPNRDNGQFEMVQNGGNWQVRLLNVPIGQWESNGELNTTGGLTMVGHTTMNGTLRFEGVPIASTVTYVTTSSTPYSNDTRVESRNLLLRINEDCSVSEVPGGTTVAIGVH